jgi:hypothetical protein
MKNKKKTILKDIPVKNNLLVKRIRLEETFSKLKKKII